MKIVINAQNGIVNNGNSCKIVYIMRKAIQGEKITLGFIGGSITQGCSSSLPTTCYAYLVYQWWIKTFPKAEFEYVNAGIGGTTSEFASARVEADLLSKNPDFVMVEFSVNDENTAHFMETYEGLIRRIIKADSSPASMILHNIMYDSGKNAQEAHMEVGKHYQIPCVSIREAVYPEILKEKLKAADIAPDNLHPNDLGHEILAQVVCAYLENCYQELESEVMCVDELSQVLAEPITKNRYESSFRYQNGNCNPVLNGFVPDLTKQTDIREIFKNGWYGEARGASVQFETEARCIALQYRKTIQKPAPIALAILDYDEEHAILLDANFEEDWGDSLALVTIYESERKDAHHLEIRIIEDHPEDQLPFYLTSVICS